MGKLQLVTEGLKNTFSEVDSTNYFTKSNIINAMNIFFRVQEQKITQNFGRHYIKF